jgi:hypothetical protein
MKNESPLFIYSMVPVEKTTFKHFFETGPLKSLLENPGQLRNFGWDLTTQEPARIVKGQYLELKSAERKLLQVYEDGSFFVRVSAAHDYLAWGVNEGIPQQWGRLNTLALIEFSLNFCLLCARLVEHLEPQPSEVVLRVEIRNAFFGKSKLYLTPHSVSSYSFGFGDDSKIAPESSMKGHVQVLTERLKSRPQEAAYLLVRQIFIWFGIREDMIPYASVENDVRFIDANKIKQARSF